MQAIILAAGHATRMYPLTENMPKALLPLRGKPVIDYIIDQLNHISEIENIYVVTNSKFYAHFSKWAETVPSDKPLSVLDNGTTTNEDRRGAVGDVFFTIKEKAINDEIVVVASDNYFTYDLREQLNFFRLTGCDTLCGKELDDIEKLRSFGVAVLASDGKLLDFEEKPQHPKSNIAIYAVYFFRKETTALFETFLSEGNSSDNIGSFPQWLSKTHDIYTYIMNGDCYDIGTVEMYNEFNK